MRNLSVLLVGLGNLGRRHVESIINHDNDISIDILEINEDNIRSFRENNDEKSIKNCNFISYGELKDHYFILIHATSSLPRIQILLDLQELTSWSYLISEKFMFPFKKDFYNFEKEYKFGLDKVFINCPRRYYDGYTNLKDIFKEYNNASKIKIKVEGNNWGLGTNAIHFLDIFCHLTDRNISYLKSNNLTKHSSKRDGYDEINGEITYIDDNLEIRLISVDDINAANYLIEIKLDNVSILIDENQSTLEMTSPKSTDVIAFPMLYQSQLTSFYLIDLYVNGECQLPKYQNIRNLHIHFLDVIKDTEAIIT